MEQTNRLPEEIARTLMSDPAFSICLDRSLEEPELIAQFIRIYGVELPRQPRNALDMMVDEATGYRKDTFDKFFTAFIPFVHRAVYLPLLSKFSAEQPVKGEF
ncbi:hypothetical protein [Rahnella sp. ChDrAdgB13]|uniref:hypothetical protein n=1 Tax=Rahnella sp. ChDrAdgB13 TaxID=1850581 RepID=UPI001AD8975E|nr:hypothetical protein [Rahnella sp. ChDrAdgB13]